MDEKAVDNVDRFVHNVERRGKKGVKNLVERWDKIGKKCE